MFKQQFQLWGGLSKSKNKENLTQKILERGRVMGLYKKGAISYRRMTKDVVSRITNKALQQNHKFEDKIITSTIKGKAYTLKLGSKSSLPQIQNTQNFLSRMYSRRKLPFQQPNTSKQRSHSISICHNKSARINLNEYVKKTPKLKFKRDVSQLIDSCSSYLKQIKN